MIKDVDGGTEGDGSTRDRIVAATVELMAEVGIDRVRTRSIAGRAGVNPALVHYYFGSVSALVMEAAQHALLNELGPSIDVLMAAPSAGAGIAGMLAWIEQEGGRNPGSTILAESMVKATRDPAFRRWAQRASRRFRSLIRKRLETARDDGELDSDLDLDATATLLAAALDGLLFHHLVDPKLDVAATAGPLAGLLAPHGGRAERPR